MRELPFQCFERHIYDTLQLNVKRNFTLESLHAPKMPINGNITTHTGHDIGQALQAVVPHGSFSANPLNTSSKDGNVQLFASPLHRSIICSIANNFAGIESLPKEEIFKYLRGLTTNEMFQWILSKQNLHTTQALTHNLFNAAIEIGDYQVLELVLASTQSSLQTNKTFLVDGAVYTPLERAAILGHNAVVRVLLKHATDAMTPSAGHGPRSEVSRVFDALVKATGVRYTSDPELLRILLESGANPNVATVRALCCQFPADEKLILSIVQKYGPQRWSDWNESGATLSMFKRLEPETLRRIVDVMIENGVDLDFEYARYTDLRGEPATIIDAVALRGHLHSVTKLCEAGAKLTSDTLSFAIKSGHDDLMLYVLKHPGRINSMPRHRLTPLGAAIRRRNGKFLDLICSDEPLMDMERHLGFQSALLEASSSGNSAWVGYVLTVCNDISSEQLGEALQYATAMKKRDIALTLLTAGADPNICTRSGNSRIDTPPLCAALEHGDHILVKALLNADADPNYDTWDWDEDDSGICPAIAFAASSKDKGLIETLIKAGANVNPAISGFLDSPLGLAVRQKNRDLFKFLVQCGCGINEGNSEVSHPSALYYAVETGDIDMVRYVLDYGADPHDSQALQFAAGDFIAAFDLLLERHREHYRNRRPWGADVLWDAIDYDDFEQFQQMLRYGGNPSHFPEVKFGQRVDNRNIELAEMTPFGLSIAISAEVGLKYAECLLQNKAKWNCRPETIVSDTTRYRGDDPVSRLTAFLVAIETRYPPVIHLLLKEGANVNFPPELGVKRTPLQKAAEIGHVETVQLLLDRGADVNGPAAERGGGTALQLAALKGNFDVIRLLLEHGADLYANPSSVNGRTALEGAAEHGRLDVLQFLLSADARTKKEKLHHIAKARAIAMTQKSSRPYIVEVLDAYLRDDPNSFYSAGPVQHNNGPGATVVLDSSCCQSTTWEDSGGVDSVMRDADDGLNDAFGSPSFDAFLNFDAIEA